LDDKDLLIAIIGRHASTSGWASLLYEDGLTFQTYTSVEQIKCTPDITIFLNDSGITPNDWKLSPAIFDQQCPPNSKIYTLAWAENIFCENGKNFFAPFRGWAIQWDGQSLGKFTLAREGESPYYPIACFDGQNTFIVGDLSDSLISRGYSFRPICIGSIEEVHQLHPPVQKEKAQRFLRDVFSTALTRAGLPAIRLSPYPPNHSIPFIFRVDIDYLIDPIMAPIRQWASDLGWKITAFVNISGEEKWEDDIELQQGFCQPIENLNWLSEFQREGHEVACHGFFHSIWPDFETTLTDLKKAKAILENLVNGNVIGYATPGGSWHPLIGIAAISAGFVYTTEASLAHGGNPFYPLVGQISKYPIQIPCSPLYPACYELGENVEVKFLNLFRALVQEAVIYREPISFMGHPFDLESASPTLWRGIAEIIDSLHCQPVTMAELSQILIQREKVNLRIYKSNNNWFASADLNWEILVNGHPILVGPNVKPICLSIRN
jgi:peptidoglycan/xylan/chitin deacetylase (PgdA/CDA1 family)